MTAQRAAAAQRDSPSHQMLLLLFCVLLVPVVSPASQLWERHCQWVVLLMRCSCHWLFLPFTQATTRLSPPFNCAEISSRMVPKPKGSTGISILDAVEGTDAPVLSNLGNSGADENGDRTSDGNGLPGSHARNAIVGRGNGGDSDSIALEEESMLAVPAFVIPEAYCLDGVAVTLNGRDITADVMVSSVTTI